VSSIEVFLTFNVCIIETRTCSNILFEIIQCDKRDVNIPNGTYKGYILSYSIFVILFLESTAAKEKNKYSVVWMKIFA